MTGLGRKLLARRPARPWIAYDATRALAAHLDPRRSRVLEFGSGMSTAWYAAHAATVESVENDRVWHQAVAKQLSGLHGVNLRFAAQREEYVRIAEGEAYDLIMIDGDWRCDCAILACRHLADGGVIYLDNSDKQGGTSGNLGEARRILIEFAEREGLPWAEITDFAPTQFFVERGLWVGPNPPV